MRRAFVAAIAALLVAGVIGLVGCGTKTVKIGDTKVTEKNGETRVETKEGETTVTTKNPTEEEIGIPIYPGAKMDENSSISGKNEKGEATFSAAVLWTDDDVNKVTAWYKDKLSAKPNFNQVSTAEQGKPATVFMFQSDDNYKMVTVGTGDVDHPGKTVIATGGASPSAVPQPPK